MLYLTRYADQKILINDNILITVVKIENGRVTLGFEAPKHIPIERTELIESSILEEIMAKFDSKFSENPES